MSVAYQMTMPVIIYCLGGEMVYILCSRLKAQEIPEEKSIKVIHDVVQSLFEPKFIAELTKKKDMSKHQEVRLLFEKLAHSSIMRLNPTSMTKLFELMLMALKLQILRAKYSEEIYKVTMNHLESVLSLLTKQDSKGNSQIIGYVTEAKDKFNQAYLKFTPYDFIILRDALLRFLQGKNVKVSIFIQETLQSNNSTIYLPMNEMAPPYSLKPGVIKKYDMKENVIENDFIKLKLSNLYIQNTNTDRLNKFNSDFGMNMFSGERKLNIIGRENIKDVTKDFNISPQETTKKTPNTEQDKKQNNSPLIGREGKIGGTTIKESTFLPQTDDNNNIVNKKNLEEQRKLLSQSTKKEFNELSDLLTTQLSNEAGTFKLDLFKSNIASSEEETEDYIDIKIDNQNDLKNKYNASLKIDEKNEDEDEDDLLDLMDKAAK